MPWFAQDIVKDKKQYTRQITLLGWNVICHCQWQADSIKLNIRSVYGPKSSSVNSAYEILESRPLLCFPVGLIILLLKKQQHKAIMELRPQVACSKHSYRCYVGVWRIGLKKFFCNKTESVSVLQEGGRVNSSMGCTVNLTDNCCLKSNHDMCAWWLQNAVNCL